MSMESSGSGQQSDSKIGCARLVVFFCVSRVSALGPRSGHSPDKRIASNSNWSHSKQPRRFSWQFCKRDRVAHHAH